MNKSRNYTLHSSNWFFLFYLYILHYLKIEDKNKHIYGWLILYATGSTICVIRYAEHITKNLLSNWFKHNKSHQMDNKRFQFTVPLWSSVDTLEMHQYVKMMPQSLVFIERFVPGFASRFSDVDVYRTISIDSVIYFFHLKCVFIADIDEIREREPCAKRRLWR